MATLPNVTIPVVPPEAPEDPDFPALDPINTFNLVGPTAANRQPNALKTRDFTLRDRVNLLVANMNEISTGDPNDNLIKFLPRDGTNPMTADLDMGGKKFVNYGVLLPEPSGTPDDYVQVSAGTYQKAGGTGYKTVGAQSVQITTPVGGGQTRYDLVHLDDAGALAVTQGAAGTPGVVPDFLDDKLTLAVVKVDETGTIVIDAADITDVRPFLAADQNARRIHNRPVDAAAPATDNAYIWDGAKWAPGLADAKELQGRSVDSGVPAVNNLLLWDGAKWTDSAPLGWGLKVEVSSESALSAVTVGESGCDYTTIAEAITYINGLTRSQARQCAIFVFEKRDGQDWTISTAFTIPTWTHLIGIGKPTLKTTVATAAAIAMNEGTSIENFNIEIGAAGWTYQVFLGSDDSVARNVDIRFEQGTSDSDYAFGLQGNRSKVLDCKVLAKTGDATKCCNGVKILADKHEQEVRNCRIEFYQYGVNFVGLSDGVSITDNVFTSGASPIGAVFMDTALGTVSDLMISRNRISFSVSAGAEAYGIKIKQTNLYNLMISENLIDIANDDALTGIYVEMTSAAILSKVVVSGNGVSISIATSTLLGHCINVTAVRAAITGNDCIMRRDGVGNTFGISLEAPTPGGVSVSTVTGNVCEAYDGNGTTTGILVLSEYNTITGNVCYSNLDEGIKLQSGADYNSVVANVVPNTIADAGANNKLAHNIGDATHTL